MKLEGGRWYLYYNFTIPRCKRKAGFDSILAGVVVADVIAQKLNRCADETFTLGKTAPQLLSQCRLLSSRPSRLYIYSDGCQRMAPYVCSSWRDIFGLYQHDMVRRTGVRRAGSDWGMNATSA